MSASDVVVYAMLLVIVLGIVGLGILQWRTDHPGRKR